MISTIVLGLRMVKQLLKVCLYTGETDSWGREGCMCMWFFLSSAPGSLGVQGLSYVDGKALPLLDIWVAGTHLALGEMQTSGLKESCRYTSEGKRKVHKIPPWKTISQETLHPFILLQLPILYIPLQVSILCSSSSQICTWRQKQQNLRPDLPAS